MMMLQELPLAMLLLLLATAARMKAAECSVPGTGAVVSGTCHWDGRVEVSWSAYEGIELHYNCTTGEVEKNGRIYGWGYQSNGRKTFNVDGWNYYNSTCYFHGCYEDIDYTTFLIPSVTCTVLMPPMLPTSTFIPSALIQSTEGSLHSPSPDDYPDIPASLSDHFISETEFTSTSSHPTEKTSLLVFISESEFTSTSSHPSEKASLLIVAATVATLVFMSLAVVLIVIGLTSVKLRKQRYYGIHKLPYAYTEYEGMIESNVDIKDKVAHTKSVESIFDQFVNSNGDKLKVSSMVEAGGMDVVDPDAVSECKTVPLGEEAVEAEEEEEDEEDEDHCFTNDKNLEQRREVDLNEEDQRSERRFCFSPMHLMFHPMKSRGDTSASTSGQTSDYMCTSYSSGANTVSTNNMEYVLFPEDFSPLPEDFSPLPDQETEGNEFCTEMSHQHMLSLESFPCLNGRSLRPDVGAETGLDLGQELGAMFDERQADFSCILQGKFSADLNNTPMDKKMGDEKRRCSGDESGTGCGFEEDVTEGVVYGERGVEGGGTSGDDGSVVDSCAAGDSYVGRGETEMRYQHSECEAD